MGFEKWEDAASYMPREGDTLREIAKRETDAGNPLTWQELALFNWGTDDEDEVETYMRDELGARARGADKRFVLSADDQPRTVLKIPRRFERRGLVVDAKYVIRVRRKRNPPQFLACCSLPAITFGFASSFIRSSVVGHLRELEQLIRQHQDVRLMIFGHTDAVGDQLYNKKLSERRAWSTWAFIVNDTDVWETLYNHGSENWGIPVVQEILADLGHYSGAVDNQLGKATRDAMCRFLGLRPGSSVANDAVFRKKLFGAYMSGKHDIKLERNAFLDPGYMGCGEFNLIEDSDSAAEANRRVTFYLFHPDRAPNLPCKFGDIGPCKRQMITRSHRHIDGFSCSFYDSWAEKCPAEAPPWLEVYLLDYNGYPMPNVPYEARSAGAVLQSGTTNENGVARLPLSSPPVVTIDWGTSLPGDAGAFRFSAEHHLEIPGGREGCRRMLANLGYLDDPGAGNYVRDFQQEWGQKATGEQSHILDLITKWHSTGVPPDLVLDDLAEVPDPWGEEIEPDEENPDGECGAAEEVDEP
ncbi:OmpA family protein [Luteimonas salinilitoris]|uniref:OmpA family protein n=1 Tax=Luteimonas salinilitoris TaxID=3237697 RepID=A0ABV4HTR3_9GAMM